MKPALIVAALLGSRSVASAMIGDTPDQVATRYGPPKQVMAERGNYREVGYIFGEIAVLVKFIGGVSQKEGFARFDKAAFPPDAVQKILELSTANAARWEEVHAEEDSDRTWKRSDGKAKALLLHRNFIVIQDVNYVEPPK